MVEKLNYKMFEKINKIIRLRKNKLLKNMFGDSGNDEKIPSINRDGPLLNRLAVKAIAGFDSVLDKKSRLYLRLLARLTDKAFNEYGNARNCLLEEIETKDRLMWRFEIINHFENCINAVNRAGKVLDIIKNGISFKKRKVSKSLDIKKLINKATLSHVLTSDLSFIRNRVEHIDEDIYTNVFKNGLFLDVNSSYEKSV